MPSAQIRLRVQASARQDQVTGIRDGVVVVRVRAPAIEGRANASVCRLLAKRLGVARSAVKIVRGHTARDKVVEVQGLDQPAVLDALAG